MFPILFYCGIRFAKDSPTADIKISHGEFHLEFSVGRDKDRIDHAIQFTAAVSRYQYKVRARLIGLILLPYQELFEQSLGFTQDKIYELLISSMQKLTAVETEDDDE